MDDPSGTRVVRPRGAVAIARFAIVLACALYIWGAPFARQVLGVTSPALRSWQMFSGAGLFVTQARYWQARDGELVPLDRRAVAARAKKPPRFESADEAKKTARLFCAELGAGADVRVELREATREGWRTTLSPGTNRCAR